MQDSGLNVMWIESGPILVENTTEHVMSGKDCAKMTRAHKITLQAMGVLLLIIRAERDGTWDLHLYSIGQIVPHFHRYDHATYARWGVIYLAQVNQLPVEVLHQFLQGN